MLGGGGGAYKTFEYNDNLLAAIRMVFIKLPHTKIIVVCLCVCVWGGGGGGGGAYNTI